MDDLSLLKMTETEVANQGMRERVGRRGAARWHRSDEEQEENGTKVSYLHAVTTTLPDATNRFAKHRSLKNKFHPDGLMARAHAYYCPGQA